MERDPPPPERFVRLRFTGDHPEGTPISRPEYERLLRARNDDHFETFIDGRKVWRRSGERGPRESFLTDGEHYLLFAFVRKWGTSLNSVQLAKDAPMKVDAGPALFKRMRAKMDTQIVRRRWRLFSLTKSSTVEENVFHSFEPTDPERVCILDAYEERPQSRTGIEFEESSEPHKVRDQKTEFNAGALTAPNPVTTATSPPAARGRVRKPQTRCPCAIEMRSAGYHRQDQVVVVSLALTKRTRRRFVIVEGVWLTAGGVRFALDDIVPHEAYPGRWLPSLPFKILTMRSGKIAFHVPADVASRLGDDARVVVRLGPSMGVWKKSVTIAGLPR